MNDGRFFLKIGRFARNLLQKFSPGRFAWRGATAGFVSIQAIVVFTAAKYSFSSLGWWAVLAGFLLIELASFVTAALIIYLPRIHRLFPPLYRWAIASSILLITLLVTLGMTVLTGLLALLLGLFICASLSGAGIAVLASRGWSRINNLQRWVAITGLFVGLLGLIGLGYFVLDSGSPAAPPVNALTQVDTPLLSIDMADPSLTGQYSVRTLTYGSGTDRHRPEYGSQADITTGTVDGSMLLDGWSNLRTWYWGFGPERLPINGRVWYPEADGESPLFLIVHGNHLMEDYSDTGYAYLGELLASRGYIVVSVDENFLNFSLTADLFLLRGLEEENDARGWLLLEHLRVWETFNNTPGNPFYKRVDIDNIALAGHSRGGEAIAVAAAFNRLSHYPDNAELRFDYDFNIRSLVAIAPIDGQYAPTGRRTPLEDVNFFVLHGAHDMDVFFYSGSDAYQRVHFSGDRFLFKAGLYIYGANHGQFNTIWGKNDSLEPIMRVFNLEQLMPMEDQQKIASVYISAFLDATLKGEQRYLPMFRDPRTAAGWLPGTIYLSQYQDSDTQVIADFSEDIDLNSTTAPGGRIDGNHLSVWHEDYVDFKWESTINHAVYLGWDQDLQPGTPQYTIDISGLEESPSSVGYLTFSLADANLNPNLNDEDYEPTTADERQPIELSVLLTDANGTHSSLPLSWYAPLQPQIEGVLTKARWMTAPPVGISEPVFQTFEFPLSAFQFEEPGFDPGQLQSASLVFESTPAGVVILDNFGFRCP